MIALDSIAQSAHLFGCLPDPPGARWPDLQLSKLAGIVGDASVAIDNSIYFKPVSNQFRLPACVANAGADLMEAASIIEKMELAEVLAQAKGEAFDFGAELANIMALVPDLSRMFLWWNCRNEMVPNRAADPTSGTFIRLAMDVLQRHGICTEATWQYSENDEFTKRRPPIIAYQEAFAHRFTSFYEITDRGDALIQQLINILSARHNAAFATLVDPASYSAYKDGVVHPPVSGSGHAQVICGWDPARQAFKVRNSWTQAWGLDGYCWMGVDYVTWQNTGCFWVPTKGNF